MQNFIRNSYVLLISCLVVWSCSSAQAGMTFSWSMESETPDVYPAGSDSTPGYGFRGVSIRGTDEAHSGHYSLDLSGGSWKSAVFDNPTNNHVWASPQEGAVVMWFKYTGEFSGGMLWMITGKSKGTPLDTNDGVSVRFQSEDEIRMGYGWETDTGYGGVRMTYTHHEPFIADQWYKVTAKWNIAEQPHLFLQIDDETPRITTEQFGPTKAVAWHQVLLGNDLNLAPEGLYIDDVQIYDDYAMTPEPGGLAIIMAGVIALLGKRR